MHDYSRHACALTARFHPYHAGQRDGLVSVTLSVPRPDGYRVRIPSVRWCGALRCPDFPLPLQEAIDSSQMQGDNEPKRGEVRHREQLFFDKAPPILNG